MIVLTHFDQILLFHDPERSSSAFLPFTLGMEDNCIKAAVF